LQESELADQVQKLLVKHSGQEKVTSFFSFSCYFYLFYESSSLFFFSYLDV